MTLSILFCAIFLVNGAFVLCFLRDLRQNYQLLAKEKGNTILLALSSPFIFFLATFGISDFAISTLLYRKANIIPDEILPGTLNTQCVIPLVIMALSFITAIHVDTVTLISCILAQVLGAYFGPRFTLKLPIYIIRISIGMGLMIAAGFILAGLFHLIPSSGIETKLSSGHLLIAMVCLFIFGVLNNIGIGSFAPTMATVYALGLSPDVAFPIMMGACAFSVPVGSMQFIKFGQYSRKITLLTSTFGVLGVIAGVSLVKQLDLSSLQWAVSAILLYSGGSMLLNELRTSPLAVTE